MKQFTPIYLKKFFSLIAGITFLFLLLNGYLSNAQTCPGQPFFNYPGGNITYTASDSMGKCYHNLQAGQTYCFSFIQPDSAILEMDINMSGCSTCAYDMYSHVTAFGIVNSIYGGGSATANNRCGTLRANGANCIWNTYGPACNLLSTSGGVVVGGCTGFVVGQVYTVCYTVPQGCGGMSICPLMNCRSCIMPSCVPPTVTISHSPTAGCDSNTIYSGYGPQTITLTANSTSAINSYQWYLNGAAITGDTTRSITVSASGYYNVIADSSGCKSDSTDMGIQIRVVDIRCGRNLRKVLLCHVPNGNPANAHTICIAPSAVPAHLRDHAGDCIGPCSLHRMANEESEEVIENDVELYSFSNPSAETVIGFSVPQDESATLEIYDMQGKMIEVPFDGMAVKNNSYRFTLIGRDLQAGIYVALLRTGDAVIHQRIVVAK